MSLIPPAVGPALLHKQSKRQRDSRRRRVAQRIELLGVVHGGHEFFPLEVHHREREHGHSTPIGRGLARQATAHEELLLHTCVRVVDRIGELRHRPAGRYFAVERERIHIEASFLRAGRNQEVDERNRVFAVPRRLGELFRRPGDGRPVGERDGYPKEDPVVARVDGAVAVRVGEELHDIK